MRGRVGGWEIRPLAHFAIIRVSRVIFRQHISQRAAGEGGRLPNHCLFPLVVLDFLSYLASFCLFISPPSICILPFPIFLRPSVSFRLLLPTTLVKPPHYPTLPHTGYWFRHTTPAVRDPGLLSPARVCACTCTCTSAPDDAFVCVFSHRAALPPSPFVPLCSRRSAVKAAKAERGWRRETDRVRVRGKRDVKRDGKRERERQTRGRWGERGSLINCTKWQLA